MSNIEQLRLTFDSQLYLTSVEDIESLFDSIPDDSNGIEEFCSYFEMDRWYQEALEAHNPDIREWLSEALIEAKIEEEIIAEDERELERSIRSSQGWNF